MNWKQALTNLNPFKKQDAVRKVGRPKAGEEKELAPVRQPEYAMQTWKLTEEQKLLVINMIGRCMTPKEIAEVCKTEHGFKLEPQAVYRYANTEKWKPMIKKIKEEYLANIADVAGSHKRVRVERADQVYEKALAKNDLKTAISAVEHQRKEMEEKVVQSQLSLTLNQYNLMSDEELEYRKNELMTKLSKKKVIELPKEESNGNG